MLLNGSQNIFRPWAYSCTFVKVCSNILEFSKDGWNLRRISSAFLESTIKNDVKKEKDEYNSKL